MIVWICFIGRSENRLHNDTICNLLFHEACYGSIAPTKKLALLRRKHENTRPLQRAGFFKLERTP